MRYADAFIYGFSDEMEKDALVGGILSAGRAIKGLFTAKKAITAGSAAKSYVKPVIKKTWNVAKKNPMLTAQVATTAPALLSRPKVAKPPNPSPGLVQKVAELL